MPSERINNRREVSQKVCKEIAQELNISEDNIDIQTAVMVALGLDEITKILNIEWTVDCLKKIVSKIDFRAWSEYEEIILEESILPEGAPQLLTEGTIRFQGEIWRIFKYDPYPFPCSPHAHNLKTGYKLDLSNGMLYKKREYVDTINKNT
jgi:hypothetical protein